MLDNKQAHVRVNNVLRSAQSNNNVSAGFSWPSKIGNMHTDCSHALLVFSINIDLLNATQCVFVTGFKGLSHISHRQHQTKENPSVALLRLQRWRNLQVVCYYLAYINNREFGHHI
jgi:hypothetical protein